MRINYNVSAMVANNSLTRSDNKLSKSIERLSSGLKINRAKDNASGLAIAKRMNAQLRGLSVANDNANDGVSVVETADGALSEVHSMLQRMNELAVKGANGTWAEADRKTIEDEIIQLQDAIQEITDSTQFNGQTLLDGSFDLKGYTSQIDVKVDYYSDEVTAKDYVLTALTVNLDADGNITDSVNDLNTNNLDASTAGGFPPNCKVTEVNGNRVTIADRDGFEMRLAMVGNAPGTVVVQDMDITITGIGDMSVQIGANEGQTLDMRIPDVSLANIGIDDLDFSSAEGCSESIEKIKGAINYISSVRSRLGAYQNRLESTVSSLDVTYESMTAAYSRIMDVDMAKEMTEYSNLQVLTQAGTTVLAQANERPSQVLQLLQ